jgi:hypothetical protein
MQEGLIDHHLPRFFQSQNAIEKTTSVSSHA